MDTQTASPVLSPTTAWYALRVRPKHEQSVTDTLTAKGMETFLPRYLTRRQYGQRYKSIRLPLFAGYTFAKFDAKERMPVLTTDGVLYILGSGREPSPVDTAEIEDLRTAVDSNLAITPHPFLAVGDRVRIAEGPMNGAEGILVSAEGQDRLVVSITLLQRSVSVGIDRAWARPT